MIYILGIDTSCDETSAAVCLENRLLSNVIVSSVEKHAKWGGVVPAFAKQSHMENIDFVVEKALSEAGIKSTALSAIAVTYGPGLAIALEVGISKAKELARIQHIPLIGVNHMAGHIYSNFANLDGNENIEDSIEFPLMALLISGGHTELILMEKHLDFRKVGYTLDDSVGEAFDKVGNMLGWKYPGGPEIERNASQGDSEKYNFPIAMTKSDELWFSYSGLKTAVLRVIESVGKPMNLSTSNVGMSPQGFVPTISKKVTYELSKAQKSNIAASFQKAAIGQLVFKTRQALERYPVKSLLVGGGVVNNQKVIVAFTQLAKEFDIQFFYPKSRILLTDNAGMIAVCGRYMFQYGINMSEDIDSLDRVPRLSL